MPAKDAAEYMRNYRARQKEEEKATPKRSPEEEASLAKRFPSGYRPKPGDDWVAKMTQAQRDAILDRINNPNRKR